jgi:hypothetical protein
MAQTVGAVGLYFKFGYNNIIQGEKSMEKTYLTIVLRSLVSSTEEGKKLFKEIEALLEAWENLEISGQINTSLTMG